MHRQAQVVIWVPVLQASALALPGEAIRDLH
jgi:hypothetical protein